MKPSLKILVPIDFSQHSMETLEFALTLRNFAEASFVLLHVVPTAEVDVFLTLGGEPGEAAILRQEEALAGLKREVERHRLAHPDLQFDVHVCSGIPFKEICNYADQENVQLIVIGTHGRTGLSHLLIGSVAERVVQHATCPVLSIKPHIL